MNTNTAAPTLFREVERKLRVDKTFVLPELVAFPNVSRVSDDDLRELTATYHDTEDLRLFRWGVTLRRREGGPDEGWHMKLPVAGAGEGVRDEVHLPLSAGPVGVVPARLAELVTAFTLGAPLGPVATVANRRRPYTLFSQAGVPLVEVAHDNVTVTDETGGRTRFREVEVEALQSSAVDSGLIALIADAIQASGGRPTTDSKVTSGLGPQASEPPPIPKRSSAELGDNAGDFLTSYLAKQACRAILQDVRVRRELPDAIHKLRVAFRRIRSALTTFGRIFSPDWARDLRSELRWAAGELSPLRDAEVMRETLLARVDRLGSKDREPVAGVVRYQLDKRIAAGTSRAWATLASSRYRRLLGSLETAATAPHLAAAATEPAEQALLPLAAKRWARLADDVAGLTLEAPATAWHTVRKDAKKVRYATEELASIPGMSLSAFAEQLEKVTELLGDHQDAHVARTTLRQIAGGESGAIGYSLGLLGAHQTALEHRARRGFLALWPAVADAQVSAGLITK